MAMSSEVSDLSSGLLVDEDAVLAVENPRLQYLFFVAFENDVARPVVPPRDAKSFTVPQGLEEAYACWNSHRSELSCFMCLLKC